MPLRLNLYHEVQKQAALKRRDPLKLSLYGLSAVAACMAGYYFLQLGKSHGLNSELDRLKTEHAKLDPESKTAAKREEELTVKIKVNESMERRIEERFYWAPLLEQLAGVVPREVQLTKVTGEIATDATSKCSLVINGISAGTDARRIAEDLRIAIAEKLGAKYRHVTATFRSLDDSPDPVTLEGRQLPTAAFVIGVDLQWGGETLAAAAPVRRKR
jgi:Tfp pilus assembly protein PilN